MSARAVLLALLVATAVRAPAAGPGACAVPVAMPTTHLLVAQAPAASPAAAEDAIAAAARLVSEGRMSEARAALRTALEKPASLAPEREALGWSLAALASASEGDLAAARSAVASSRALLGARASGTDAAAAYLALGWATAELGDVPRTREAFESAAASAQRAGDAALAATALVHRALLEGRIAADAEGAARAARAAVAKLPDAALRARLGVALGLALLPEHRAERGSTSGLLAHGILSAAYADASAARQPRELAHALGLLGEMQWLRGDARAAVATLERAVAASRSIPDDPWRFRWSWKLGVALRDAGESAKAIEKLQEAVDLLEEAKARRSLGRFSASTLARDYRRAYLDLADILLSQPAGIDTPEASTGLRRVRSTLELSRTAEIEDFFRDPCMAARSARVADPEALDATAALIHPVLLDDRVEILVSHRSGIARFSVPKDARSVGREVQRLRNAVERPGSPRYLDSAARLHGWLVEPMAAHLAKLGVKTLVWVPDGALRGLPFAALHDGRSHLAERFAIAVTPVATLTDPRPLAAAGVRASLSGLTVASQGFAALPGVAAELDGLSKLLGVGALRDERFTVAALEDSLRRSPVNALHIASHGQFAPEAGETFLLAHDGRLTLPQLRAALAAGKIREEPIELMVLSACQTAAGDERAALGLAGVAIGAGARSALATLWAVSDESTALLSEGFYRRLLAGNASRAQALREAQLALLADARFSHPFFWAPYLLIGNWM